MLIITPDIQTSETTHNHTNPILWLFLSILIISFVLVSIVMLDTVKPDNDLLTLRNLESKLDEGISLSKEERITYCMLLQSVRKIYLDNCVVRYACSDAATHQPNFYRCSSPVVASFLNLQIENIVRKQIIYSMIKTKHSTGRETTLDTIRKTSTMPKEEFYGSGKIKREILFNGIMETGDGDPESLDFHI